MLAGSSYRRSELLTVAPGGRPCTFTPPLRHERSSATASPASGRALLHAGQVRPDPSILFSASAARAPCHTGTRSNGGAHFEALGWWSVGPAGPGGAIGSTGW